jgi:ERCC4-type nuclease
MIILCDSREKENTHIIRQFYKLGIDWKVQKLRSGDYSMEFNGNSYENKIFIERKNSPNEVAQNLTKHKERFKNEFERSKGCIVYLMIEGSMDDIENHRYRSRLTPSEFKSRLSTWSNHFGFKIEFVKKEEVAKFIIETFKKYLEVGYDKKINRSTKIEIQ